jgi:hypothetical protein
MSNKLWKSKDKRKRVPDLLRLKTGIRFESRAKVNLEVTMSHAKNEPDRAWDKGLRDGDVIAFIRCSLQGDNWIPSDRMALFRVGEMRRKKRLARLSNRKAASEGSEVQLTWPATIPKKSGRVVSVSRDQIKTRLDSGGHQTYSLSRPGKKFRLHPHVAVGDIFGEGDTIIASAMPRLVLPTRPVVSQYDFLADLQSDERETVYAAVKALGFLPESAHQSVRSLSHIMAEHDDMFMQIEAATSLARLGETSGWDRIAHVATSEGPIELRMEVALILAEFPEDEALSLLDKLARNPSNPSELRAAGVWGMARRPREIETTALIDLVADEDVTTATHAIVAASRVLTDRGLDTVLDQFGRNERQSAGLVRAIIATRCDPVEKIVTRLRTAPAGARPWLIYLLASLGRERCKPHLTAHAPNLLSELEFFWTYHKENWTNRLEVADQIDFLIGQFPD